jgi:hypothetical protein
MAKQIPWDARITWYYLLDQKLFDYSTEDFERDAKELRDIGIDIVLLGHKTHFRWNYYPFWDEIGEMVVKVVKAFHKYGIKVVEHHSTSLTDKPMTDWASKIERICGDNPKYNNNWRKLQAFIEADDKIDGTRYSSMLQIDGRTGELAVSQYDTYTFCYNNEDFRRIYFHYLESLYVCGVDGIMTDDIQFFCGGNACACPTCRAQFRQQTGMELPDNGEAWNRFSGDYDNPLFVAFDQFRRSSAIRFQRDVQAHFQKLGYSMLRPNYISNEVLSNTTAYPFDNCADLWDVMFQENWHSTIGKYCWPAYFCEASHRYAFADRNGIPSMSMFYDRSPDNFYFSWALAVSWGQLYNSSFPRTESMVQAERKFRGLEKQYPDLVYEQKKLCDYAVYFSMKTRDLVGDAVQRSTNAIYTWQQGGLFTQKTHALALEEQSAEELGQYPVLVLPHVILLDEGELSRFAAYMRNGGRLVLAGECGVKTETGTDRAFQEVISLLGSNIKVRKLDRPVSAKTSICKIPLGEMQYNMVLEGGTSLAVIAEGTCVASENIGKGQLVIIGAQTNLLPYQQYVSAPRQDEDVEEPFYGTAPAPFYAVDILRSTIGVLLDVLIKRPLAEANQIENYQLTLFDSADGYHRIVHLVNFEGTLCETEGAPLSHLDILTHFDPANPAAVKNAPIFLRFECPFPPATVRLITPEAGNPIALQFTHMNGSVMAQIDGGIFSGYAMIDACRQ